MPNQKIETSEIEKDTIGDSQEYVQYAIEIERSIDGKCEKTTHEYVCC